MRKVYLILTWTWCLLTSLVLFGCSSKQSDVARDMSADDVVVKAPAIVKVEDAISMANGKALNVDVDKTDIVGFELGDNAVLSDFAIQDIVDDKILLLSGNSLQVYEMPSGRFVQKLSKRGEGRDEYRNVAAAVLSADGNDIAVVESHWQDTSSKIIEYDNQQNVVSQQPFPFIGDLVRWHNGEGFLAPNAVSVNGGESKIYRINHSFEIVDSLSCNKQYRKGAAFNMSESIDRLSKVPAVILRDTLFYISSDFQLTPAIILDYGRKGMPEGFSRRNYDNYDKYLKDYAAMIIPSQLQELGGLLFARLENENKVYYSIWSVETGELLYSRQARDTEWGFSLNIGETVFNQWPIGEWEDKLIFYLPDYVISEMTGNEDSNPGLALIPISQIKELLTK